MKNKKISNLPKAVEDYEKYLQKTEDTERSRVLQKLTCPNESFVSEYKKMWKKLYKLSAEPDGNLAVWVSAFVNGVIEASVLPNYFYFSKDERKKTKDCLEKNTNEIIHTISKLNIDKSLVFTNSATFGNGIYVYDDFSEKNRHHMDLHEDPKIKFSVLFQRMTERLKQEIDLAEKNFGKKVSDLNRLKANIFARNMRDRHMLIYNSPHNHIVSVATHAMYGIWLVNADIVKLSNRKRLAILPK